MPFIVFEGIDGCGKSTVIKRLAVDLFDMNKNNHVFLTREPYKREWLNKYFAQKNIEKKGEEAMRLFVEDRLNHCKFIKTLLDENRIVLCDRFKYSTFAYQMAQGMSFEKIKELHKTALIPDLVLILDISEKIAMQRMNRDANRKFTDGFEKEQFLRTVRENYLKQKDLLGENIVVVDGSKSPDNVYKEAKQIVCDFLKQ